MNAQAAPGITAESNQTVEQSAPAWIFYATLLLLLTVSVICEQNFRISTQFAYTQTLDEMTATAEGGNALRRVMFLALGSGGLALFMLSLRQKWSIDVPLLLVLLLVPAWCLLSILWTIDFGICARRLIVLLCCVAGAIGIGRRFSLSEICQLGFWLTLITALSGIAAEVACGTFRPWSGEYRFSGTIHPNTQGMYLALLVLSAFTLARSQPSRRWFYVACCGLALVLLILTKSRTATAAVMVALASLWLMQTNWRWQLIFGSGGAWCAGVCLLVALSSGVNVEEELKSALLLGREEQAESFTGRGEIWPVVTTFIQRSPLLGYGYESFWTPKHIAYVSDAVEWPVREAHCGYLETMLHLGAIGLLLVLLVVALAWLRSSLNYAHTHDPNFAFVGSLLLFALLDSTMESGMVTPQSVVFVTGAALFHVALCQGSVRSPSLNATESMSRRPIFDSQPLTIPARN